MFRTLRSQLILSHILPLLIIIPLMGIALIYVLETQILVANLSRELSGDASLLAQVVSENTQIWNSVQAAQSVLDQLNTGLSPKVMLISLDGQLLASSDPADKGSLGQYVEIPGVQEALAGQVMRFVRYNPFQSAEAVDVLVPSVNTQGKTVGVVRMSYRYAFVSERVQQARYLVIGVLALGLAIGGLVGWWLAVRISRPMRQVTQAIYDLASGEQRQSLVERGPQEVTLLVRAVNHLADRLHTLEQARHQLLANLVHEMGRPLGAVRSALQALSRGAAQNPRLLEELTSGMDQQVDRLQHLLEDLAHLHDQALGSLELKCEPLPLGEWLVKIAHPWQEAAQQKHLEWGMSLPEALPVIYADPLRLAQALENLLGNAIKYTPSSGKVTLSAGVEQEKAWICVADSGTGIQPDELGKIFQPFYRGDQGKRFKQGMGLGLSIANDLIHAHGGEIKVESQVGQGTRFTIWLPLSTSQEVIA